MYIQYVCDIYIFGQLRYSMRTFHVVDFHTDLCIWGKIPFEQAI